MGILNRMRALRTKLLNIRLGPGAVELPHNVKRIHLDFAFKIKDGHYGARKVWRQYLPRLKYHNPTIPMTVNRTTDQDGPATMVVYFSNVSENDPSQTGPGEGTAERTEEIDMKHKKESDILTELLQKTRGREIHATPEEESELRQLAEERIRSEQDRARTNLDLETKRREKQMLEQARGLGSAPTSTI